MIRYALVTFLLLFHTVACSLAAGVVRLFPAAEELPGRIMAWWGRRCIDMGGWPVSVRGLGNLPEGGAILVVNHQSLLDIPLLLNALGGDIRFAAKKELGEIPFFGSAMVAAGNLLVGRDDPRETVRLLREAAARIRAGRRLVVFPEGTRSDDGAIGDFKPGAFLLAQKSGAPVVPVRIDGSRDALPKGSLLFRPARLSVNVLPPLSLPAEERGSRERIAGAARAAILGASPPPAAAPPSPPAAGL